MPRRSRLNPSLVVFAVLVVAVVGGVSYLAWRQSVPRATATLDAPRFLGHKTPLTVVVEAARGRVTRAEVRVVQEGQSATVPPAVPRADRRVELPVTIEPAALGLREGPATLEVWASDDFWRPLRFEERPAITVPVIVDLTPPRLDLLGSTRYVLPGGAAVVAFRAEGAARAEVRVGDRAFPSFAHGPPERGARVALIALPHDIAPGTPVTVSAVDEAGNVATRAVPAELRPRRFPTDRIVIRDSFLQSKVPELLPQHPPDASLIEGFLTINREQRRAAEEEKQRVGSTSAETPLWAGPFVQPRNTKVFSNFAETRTYIYDGREVDRQIHFGFDLASTRQSPVPAANAGVVVFAEPLSIYGNTVILDHGLGLQTLYAHLSSVAVKPGDEVTKGQELGRTGATGLALGDHLHFEVLISGVSVTPLEWWDPKWIRDRINGPLRDAGLPAIPGLD